VEHGVDALDQREEVGLAQVRLDEGERIVVERARQVLPLRLGGLVRLEANDADDGVAPLEQRVDEVAADEAGRAGDDDASGCRRRRARGGGVLRHASVLPRVGKRRL